MIIREVEAFYRAFVDGFNREDAEVYLRSFSYPNAVLRGEHGITVHLKEAEQRQYYQTLMRALHMEGWNHTSVGALQVVPLTDSTAILVVDITRSRKDKTPIENARICYTVRKDAATWKILTLTDVKPPYSGPSPNSVSFPG